MRLLFVLFTLLPSFASAVEGPRVVVTIAPIHSLVVNIMQGVAEPQLLLQPGVSPHNYALRPSEMRALVSADLIIRIGPELETFLARALESLERPERVMDLIAVEGLPLLEYRKGGSWSDHAHETDAHADAHSDEHSIDNHIWLDPHIAALISEQITLRLIELDPANRERYGRNGDRLVRELHHLDHELDELFEPFREVPYLVLHDAYHYLEKHYHLNAIGSLLVDVDRRPGAKRLSELRARIRQGDARCVFGEPQFNRSLINTLIEEQKVGYGELDPIGAKQHPGAGLYSEMIRANARSLVECLGGK